MVKLSCLLVLAISMVQTASAANQTTLTEINNTIEAHVAHRILQSQDAYRNYSYRARTMMNQILFSTINPEDKVFYNEYFKDNGKLYWISSVRENDRLRCAATEMQEDDLYNSTYDCFSQDITIGARGQVLYLNEAAQSISDAFAAMKSDPAKLQKAVDYLFMGTFNGSLFHNFEVGLYLAKDNATGKETVLLNLVYKKNPVLNFQLHLFECGPGIRFRLGSNGTAGQLSDAPPSANAPAMVCEMGVTYYTVDDSLNKFIDVLLQPEVVRTDD